MRKKLLSNLDNDIKQAALSRDDDRSIGNLVLIQIARILYRRDADFKGRSFIKKHLIDPNLSAAGSLIHQVTATKIFYMTGLVIGSQNTNLTQLGNLVLQNGADVNDRIPFNVPPSGVLSNSMSCEENPIPFSDSVNVLRLNGNLSVSVCIWGYEE